MRLDPGNYQFRSCSGLFFLTGQFERGRDFLDEQIDRPIERRDGRDHAVRHPHREAETAGTLRGRVKRKHFTIEMWHLRRAGADALLLKQ